MATYYTIGWGSPGCLWDGHTYPLLGRRRAVAEWADWYAPLCAAHRREAVQALLEHGFWAAPGACNDEDCAAPEYHYVEVVSLTREEARELMQYD